MKCLLVVNLIQSFLSVYPSAVDALVGGDEAVQEKFKYQVSVQVYNKHTCGGGIVSERHILTAAHCVINSKDNTFKKIKFSIVAGVIDAKAKDGAIRGDVVRIFVPKEYSFLGKRGDIAVLEVMHNRTRVTRFRGCDTVIMRVDNTINFHD